jgi:hypothetical protein
MGNKKSTKKLALSRETVKNLKTKTQIKTGNTGNACPGDPAYTQLEGTCGCQKGGKYSGVCS